MFPNVVIFTTNPAPEVRSSHVFACSALPWDADRVQLAIREARPQHFGRMLSQEEVEHIEAVPGGLVLTDDFAPLELIVRNVVRNDRTDMVRYLLGAAARMASRGKMGDAIRLARRAVDYAPSNASALHALSTFLQRAGKPEEGLRTVRTAIEMDQGLLPARVTLGELLARSGAVDEAMHEWEAVLAINARDLNALSNLAYALEYLGQIENASDTWRLVLSRAPSDLTAHTNLARILSRRGDPSAARHFAKIQELRHSGQKLRPNWMPVAGASDAIRAFSL